MGINYGNYLSITDYKEELKRIICCTKKLRTTKKGRRTSWERPVEWHMKYSNIQGIPSLALTITLSPTGCEWARKGGCTMCGEFEGSLKRNELLKHPEFHIAQFVAAITEPKVWETSRQEGKPIEWIRINQEGNYINANEMDQSAQFRILSLATKIKGVKKITIESRPQYITDTTSKLLAAVIKDTDVELEIGMGFEAADDIVRNVCINKQETLDDFKRALSLLNCYGISPLAYILVKPPFITEKEAIDQAIKTAHFAKDIGFKRMSLEPMSIHPYTLVDVLSQIGHYSPPWLWSVIEVAKGCSDISNTVGIGGVGYYPIPKRYSQNQCYADANCNPNVLDAIVKYNESRDVSVFNSLSCACKQTWQNVVDTSCDLSLKDRIAQQLNDVEKRIDQYAPIEVDADNLTRNKRLLASGSQ